jgi:SAM-dependent methyltransferase
MVVMLNREEHLDIGHSSWGDDPGGPEDNITISIDPILYEGDTPFRQVQATAEDIPFPSNYFASVRAGNVLSEGDEMYADMHKSLPEISRVLKPGGTLIIESLNIDSGETILKILKDLNFTIMPKSYRDDESWYIWATKRRY